MIQRAYLYQKELNTFLSDYQNREYLKYWISGAFINNMAESEKSEWNTIQTVSMFNSSVIGYMTAYIDRECNKVSGISILNTTKKPSHIMARDTLQFIDDLLYYYKFRKIEFTVVIGNPAEIIYDKILSKLDGRIIGIQKQSVKLIDGLLYDEKLYEIFPR